MTTVHNTWMVAGRAKTFRGFLKNASGQFVNDTGATYRLQVRPTPESSTVIANRSSAGNGQGWQDVMLQPDDTVTFTKRKAVYYEMTVVEADGRETTLMIGQIGIRPAVRR